MRKQVSLWPWILGVLVMGGVAAWLFWPRALPLSAPRAPHAAPSKPAPAAPALPSTAPIQHPIAPEAAADAAVPPLADSDAAAWQALNGLAGGSAQAALGLLLRDHLVQRWVVMIDNLPRPSVSMRVLPYRPLQDPPRTVGGGQDGPALLDPAANAQRYAPYVQAFVAIDPQALAAAYRRFYPLFQQAYVELGYPDGYFNDRLVAVIDHLLQVPVPAEPALVEPNGRGKYRFVDPALESRSAGQKALLRLAPAQAEAVRRQLRAIRAAITQG